LATGYPALRAKRSLLETMGGDGVHIFLPVLHRSDSGSIYRNADNIG